ncbi:MAG: MBL fold metallo-hydrolase [Acutalibacteraceae bacterium]|jgi:glyoxylase-like metal-dependent hydrolase (beta-lactamase superfamily II)
MNKKDTKVKIFNAGDLVVNTYFYPIANGYVMVDTGYDNSYRRVEEKMKKSGIDFSEIHYVFLTHAHDDHAGFLNELLDRHGHIKAIVSDKSVPSLKSGRILFDGECSSIRSFLFTKLMAFSGKGEHRFPAIDDKFKNRIIEITADNQAELETILQGKILFTPGHTEDSVSLRVNDVIFCGDAAMNSFPSKKRISILMEDKSSFQRSWELMMNESAEWLYPGHGKPFHISDLKKYINHIARVKLYKFS